MRSPSRVSFAIIGTSTALSIIYGCASPEVAERDQPIATRAGLPVLRVVQSGATKDQATRLMEGLGIGAVGPGIRGSDVGSYWSIRVLEQNPCS